MLFVSPHLWVRVRCYRIRPVCHVPSVAGAVEAFFAGRDPGFGDLSYLPPGPRPLVETVGADRPVTDLHADRVAAVFAELWADRAPATWNTRRVAVQAFASWCGERWPLSGDLLAGVGPRRRRADNTRAIPVEDLEELWRRRGPRWDRVWSSSMCPPRPHGAQRTHRDGHAQEQGAPAPRRVSE